MSPPYLYLNAWINELRPNRHSRVSGRSFIVGVIPLNGPECEWFILCVTHMHPYICIYIYTYINRYIYINVYICYIYIYIFIYMYIYTRISVAALLDSSPPLALWGGSAYGPYEWCRCSSQKKKTQNGKSRFKISKLV